MRGSTRCNIDEFSKYNDFARSLNDQIIHLNIAAQESEKLTVDFNNFQLAYAEKRIPFGIELVLMQSSDLDGACFGLGVELLSMLKFDCPIWLIGLRQKISIQSFIQSSMN